MVTRSGFDRYKGIESLPHPWAPRRRPFRVDEHGKIIYFGDEDELDAARTAVEEPLVRLAELGNPSSNGYEAMRKQGERHGRALRTTVQAAKDFWHNYRDMQAANTDGGDKYFHCKANCEASSLGDAGTSVAQTISDGRESVQLLLKPHLAADSLADQKANAAGRKAGKRLRDAGSGPGRCRAACEPFRPKSLDERY
ncbi:MAG: hypothetical protein ACOY5R_18165 [Pseudomonadota bacterium]